MSGKMHDLINTARPIFVMSKFPAKVDFISLGCANALIDKEDIITPMTEDATLPHLNISRYIMPAHASSRP